ncbi:MAG: hypothetical protein JSV89_11885 [Spirochaetaceae bacterium]|nr:MAG: hypothetical protein JSV89_11885 [Spirochaetaceae bacterium]
MQRKIGALVSVDGKDWASLLEVEGFTLESTVGTPRLLESAFNIIALDADHALGILLAKNKLLKHFG